MKTCITIIVGLVALYFGFKLLIWVLDTYNGWDFIAGLFIIMMFIGWVIKQVMS